MSCIIQMHLTLEKCQLPIVSQWIVKRERWGKQRGHQCSQTWKRKRKKKRIKDTGCEQKKGQIWRGVLIPRTCIIPLKYTHYTVLVIMTLCPEVLPCQLLFTDAGCVLGAFLSCIFYFFFVPLPGKHAAAFACIMRYSLTLMAAEKCLCIVCFPRPHYSVLQ